MASEPIEIELMEGQIHIDWKKQGVFRHTLVEVENDKDEYWLLNFQRLYDEYTEAQSKLVEMSKIQEENEQLKIKVALQQQELYGTSSEKLKTQNNESSDAKMVNPVLENHLKEHPKVRDINSYSGRKPLPKDLPRERIVYDIPEAERICECCNGKLHKVGEESVEKLTVVREHYKVRVVVSEKYRCQKCETFHTAKVPKTMIPGSSFDSPEFLANVAVKRFQFGMPYDRQEKYFQSIGLPFNRTTLASLMIKSADKLVGIHELLREELLTQAVIHADETVMQVLKESGRTPQQKSYLWAFLSGSEEANKVVYFGYSESRSGQFAADTLTLNGKQYTGYLCVDGYAGYNKVFGVTRVGCMAHARRKFEDALKILPDGLDKSLAKTALTMIGELYEVENNIKDLPPEIKYQVRQQLSVTILCKIKTWLDDLHPKVLPKGPLGRATRYILDDWEYLSRFVDDGRLSIDNNSAEREIKQFVIGRKNWLFADSVAGAHTNAIMYSLVASAKANGLDPYEYLEYLFSALPNMTSSKDLKSLLPWNVRKKDQYFEMAA